MATRNNILRKQNSHVCGVALPYSVCTEERSGLNLSLPTSTVVLFRFSRQNSSEFYTEIGHNPFVGNMVILSYHKLKSYLLTPRNSVLLKKVKVVYLAFHGNRNFITVFTRFRIWSLT
jgi:hypothetical protein